MNALQRAAAIGVCAAAGSWALTGQAEGPNNKAAWGLVFVLPVAGGVLQLAFAALFPRSVRRIEGALRTGVDSAIGWGVLLLILTGLVGGILGGMGGQAGQALAGVIVGLVVLVAMAAGAGPAAVAGSWALARDGHDRAPTFVRVAAGGLLLGFAVLIPVAGWMLALALAVLSLGAVVRCTVGVPPVPDIPSPSPYAAPGGDAPCGSL